MTAAQGDLGPPAVELMGGRDEALRVSEILAPADPETFIRRLYAELDVCVTRAETKANHYSTLGEESITALAFMGPLDHIGYRVGCEPDHRGHADIIIEPGQVSGDRYRWLGEAKIHGAYDDLFYCLAQLLTRRTTGKEGRGGVILYVRTKTKTLADVMAEWRHRLEEEKAHKLQAVSDDECPGNFRSLHSHPNTGFDFEVRHFGVVLRYAPEEDGSE
ncbi:MAG: hypothetical protein SangKO_011800 [Sandaracinaceae bacterium]